MRSLRIAWLFLWIIPFVLTHISAEGGNSTEISSAAFKDREKISIYYVMPGAGGKNSSIPPSWRNTPSGTIPCEAIRTSDDPRRTILDFLDGVCGVATTLGGLDAEAFT